MDILNKKKKYLDKKKSKKFLLMSYLKVLKINLLLRLVIKLLIRSISMSFNIMIKKKIIYYWIILNDIQIIKLNKHNKF